MHGRIKNLRQPGTSNIYLIRQYRVNAAYVLPFSISPPHERNSSSASRAPEISTRFSRHGGVPADDPPGICAHSQSLHLSDALTICRGMRSRITPGSHARMVSRMLMRKSAPQPVLRKTASGGRKKPMT